MNHPEKILRILDGHLIQPTRLILYGRAALALGFESAPPSFHTTLDVDAILPEIEMSSIEADDQFWTAIEKTNDQLASTGLYITHLFTDSQVILSPDWLDHLQPICLPGLNYLQPFRPATLDLILTKMMRIDPQDRSDIEFLIAQSSPGLRDLENFLDTARIPEILEIAEAFRSNRRWIREMVSKQ